MSSGEIIINETSYHQLKSKLETLSYMAPLGPKSAVSKKIVSIYILKQHKNLHTHSLLLHSLFFYSCRTVFQSITIHTTKQRKTNNSISISQINVCRNTFVLPTSKKNKFKK